MQPIRIIHTYTCRSSVQHKHCATQTHYVPRSVRLDVNTPSLTVLSMLSVLSANVLPHSLSDPGFAPTRIARPRKLLGLLLRQAAETPRTAGRDFMALMDGCFRVRLEGFVMEFGFLRDYAEEIGLTMFVFGLLIWLYVIIFQLLYPQWVTEGAAFSHLRFPPFDWRVDDVGILSFAVSVIGFLIWRVQVKRLARSSSPRRRH